MSSTEQRRLHQHQQPRRWSRAADQPAVSSADQSIFASKKGPEDAGRRPPNAASEPADGDEDRLEDVLVLQAGVRDLVESWLPEDPEGSGDSGSAVAEAYDPDAALARPKRLGLGFKAVPKQLALAAQNEQLARQLLDNKGRKRPAPAAEEASRKSGSGSAGRGGDSSDSDSEDGESSRFSVRSKAAAAGGGSSANPAAKGFQQFQQQLLGNLRQPKKRRPKKKQKVAGGGKP